LLIVSVKSDVFPMSTMPKARLPLSDTTLVEVEVEVGVGAVGLLFPQAAAARAPRSTTRESERMGDSNAILRKSPKRVKRNCADTPGSILRSCKRSAIDLELHGATSARIARIISGFPGPLEPKDFEFDHPQPNL
jgi:hypothetical protein